MVDKITKDKIDNNFSMQNNDQLRIKRKRSDIKLSRIKRRILKHVWVVRVALITLVLFSIAAFVYMASFFLARYESASVIGFANDFVFAKGDELIRIDGKTNILILGKGGGGHEAPDLTDTIILLSIDHKDNKVTLVSIPRDLWIDDLQAKINSSYYWGKQKQEGGGTVLAKSVVEEVMGKPIQYALVFDFETFVEVIDEVGGVNVYNKRAFVDEKYPVPGKEDDTCDGGPEYKCRYETISFEEGMVLMDGETALKYVRSRNAKGDEGTDTARNMRQQQVIKALVEEVASPSTILSIRKVNKLYAIFNQGIEMDLSTRQLAVVARMLFNNRDSIHTYSIPENLFVVGEKSIKPDNLYVFFPKGETWDEIHAWFDELVGN